MNFQLNLSRAITAAILCGITLGTVGCRKRLPSSVTDAVASQRIASELQPNNLGALPGALYQSQAKSPIHWQPWTKESLEQAVSNNQLIFAVVAIPQQVDCQAVLTALASDATLVSQINQNYVPILIDGDAAREVGLLTADLCAEIKQALQLPLFLWMTPDGNPVAWIPVPKSSLSEVGNLFNKSHHMINRMWSEDSSYAIKNSLLDNSNRRVRLAQRKNTYVMSTQPAKDSLRCLRQLSSFYDPYTQSFDEAGGLLPSGAIDLLASAAIHPGISDDLRARCLKTTRALLTDILPSPMIDPLDGGIFASRRGNSWCLPLFTRDCSSQARAAVALINAYRATGDAEALKKALGVIHYAEETFATSEGLFALGLGSDFESKAWLWSVEQVNQTLSPEDATWWIKATGMKELGNLPSEVDPQRDFFRYNSLGLQQSPAQIAKDRSEPLETFAPRFESVRKKLLAARNARLGELNRDDCSHAGASFRMISAYAAAFGATGEESYREKAIALMNKTQTAFSDGPRLRLFSKDAPKSIGEGRAFLYGLAMQAALDLAAITSDDAWIDWSEDLATTAAELFTDSAFLKECPDDAKIIDLPVTDLVMLFDDSTAGLISFAECRLAHRKRPLVKSFSDLAIPLPTYTIDRPMLHTDVLTATIAREFRVTIVAGTDISPALKLASERLPMRMIQRRNSLSKDEVPAGSVMVILPDGQKRTVATPEALREVVLPLSAKL